MATVDKPQLRHVSPTDPELTRQALEHGGRARRISRRRCSKCHSSYYRNFRSS